jgi:hypothetical protein
MVIMSDVEAFGLKLSVALLLICLAVVMLVKTDRPPSETNSEYTVIPEPVSVVDTMYVKDTIYINRFIKDTIYITNQDTVIYD